MAPATKAAKVEKAEASYPTRPDTSHSTADLKISRKRTKTGCLTCRKRRIKCGEERPVCRNCIKSKRNCEGYNPRVVFKTPAFDYRPVANGAAHITFQAGPVAGPTVAYPQDYGPPSFDPAYYSHPPPRPVDQYVHEYADFQDPQHQPSFGQPIYHVGQPAPYQGAPPPPPAYIVQPSPPHQQPVAHENLPLHIIDGQAQPHGFVPHAGFSSQPLQSP